MTSERVESTSSGAVENSRPWTKTEALGRKIVQEFDLDNSVDTLGRWMAHYVAQLIDEADRASSPRKRLALRRECADVIQRLWDRRSHWPSGWPPDSAARLTEALDSTQPNRRRLPRSEGLAATLPALLEIHRNERQAWLDSILLATDTSSEETWLKDWNEEMKEDELQVLQEIIGLKSSALWRFNLQPTRNQRPPTNSEIASRLSELAESLSKDRVDLLAKTVEAIRVARPPRVKPKRRRRSDRRKSLVR